MGKKKIKDTMNLSDILKLTKKDIKELSIEDLEKLRHNIFRYKFDHFKCWGDRGRYFAHNLSNYISPKELINELKEYLDEKYSDVEVYAKDEYYNPKIVVSGEAKLTSEEKEEYKKFSKIYNLVIGLFKQKNDNTTEEEEKALLKKLKDKYEK